MSNEIHPLLYREMEEDTTDSHPRDKRVLQARQHKRPLYASKGRKKAPSQHSGIQRRRNKHVNW